MQLYIVGGDSRIGFMAEEFCHRGATVSGLGLSGTSIPKAPLYEGVRGADAVILGVPATRDEKTVFAPFSEEPIFLDALLEAAGPHTPVFCGMASPVLKKRFADAGTPLVDYFSREELALLNAVPTAEGAVEIAMHHLPITIWKANCLVAGFGRIGKYLAHILKGLGAHVTVSARKNSDFALCRTLGYPYMQTAEITRAARNFDVIFNTVPDLVIDASVLSAMRPDALVIDLASLPGGVDTDAARTFGVSVIHALSLPGKVAPKTAGKILCDTIESIHIERNL